jgi:N-acetylglucosamine-6-phosphate deacetylase
MRLGVRAALTGGALLPGDVDVDEAGSILALGLSPAGSAGIAVPGFIDLQVNGFSGVDLLSATPAEISSAAVALARTGVTAFLAALISAPPDHTIRALAALAAVDVPPGAARMLGAHLEGPFLSAERHGAHDRANLRAPDVGLIESFCAAGPVALMTLAPELDGALEAIQHLVARGIVVSLGHTAADAATAEAAFGCGARTVTHILNAMPGVSSRQPGVAGVALTRPGVDVMAIVDGAHLAAATVRLLLAAAPGRLAVVTDAIEAAGLGDGDYRLGGRDVRVADGVARLGDGTIAGGAGTMDAAVRGLVGHGASIEEAVGAATTVPARILGRDDIGDLTVGGRADVVILDDRLEVRRALVGGVEAA